MEKPSAKLSISLVIITLIAGIYYFNQENPANYIDASKAQTASVVSRKSPSDLNSNQSLPEPQNNPILLKSCLGINLSIDTQNNFDELVQKMGKHEKEHHWDNYHFDNDRGERIVVHVVPDQNQEGIQTFTVKVFREDSDGPTLIEEKQYKDRHSAQKAAQQKFESKEIKISQTVDSFQFSSGLEIQRTRENDKIVELRLQNAQGRLDCQFSSDLPSCECNKTP